MRRVGEEVGVSGGGGTGGKASVVNAPTFTAVERGGPLDAVTPHPDRTLLLCLPPSEHHVNVNVTYTPRYPLSHAKCHI